MNARALFLAALLVLCGATVFAQEFSCSECGQRYAKKGFCQEDGTRLQQVEEPEPEPAADEPEESSDDEAAKPEAEDKNKPAENREERYARIKLVLEVLAFQLEYDIDGMQRRTATLKRRLDEAVEESKAAQRELSRVKQQRRDAIRDADMLSPDEREARLESIEQQMAGKTKLLERKRNRAKRSRRHCLARLESLQEELRETRAKMPDRARELLLRNR